MTMLTKTMMLTLPALAGVLMLSACKEVPVDTSEDVAARKAAQEGKPTPESTVNTPVIPVAGGSVDEAASASAATMAWHYDGERRAALYGPPESESVFWVACKGSPDGRSLYVMMPGGQTPAGTAKLSIAGAGVSATMAVTSTQDEDIGKGDGDNDLHWSGETPLNSPVARLFETVALNVPLTVSLDSKDSRTIPNGAQIRQVLAACRS